jgi:hypothetical protein
MEEKSLLLWMFSLVGWEQVFWSIDVMTELHVIYFPEISFIEVFSHQKLELTFN